MKKILMLVLLLFFYSTFNYSNERIVFSGKPIVRISENGVSRVVEEISGKDAPEYKVTITADEDKYFWSTRNNVSLKRILSGAYINYVAVNGAGYIKVLRNDLKENLHEAKTLLKAEQNRLEPVVSCVNTPQKTLNLELSEKWRGRTDSSHYSIPLRSISL